MSTTPTLAEPALQVPALTERQRDAGFKALGHPTRMTIIRRLALAECCCGGDLCAVLPLAQSTISQHLDILRKAELIVWRPHGTKSLYTLNRPRLAALGAELQALGAGECGPCDSSETETPATGGETR